MFMWCFVDGQPLWHLTLTVWKFANVSYVNKQHMHMHSSHPSLYIINNNNTHLHSNGHPSDMALTSREYVTEDINGAFLTNKCKFCYHIYRASAKIYSACEQFQWTVNLPPSPGKKSTWVEFQKGPYNLWSVTNVLMWASPPLCTQMLVCCRLQIQRWEWQ